MRFRLWLKKFAQISQFTKNKKSRTKSPSLLLEGLEERCNPDSPALFSTAGNFQSPVNLGAVTSPVALVIGDLNKDGLPDLATANSFRNSISILLAQGKGAFAAPRNLTVAGNPQAIQMGDFNKDGNPDLVTVNYKTDNISVLFGNGDGTFKTPQNLALPTGTGPRSLILGDFNKDGLPDLATGNFENNTVSILLGQGTGQFAPPQSFSVGSNPISLAVADFNRDGKLDLATGNSGSRDLSVLLGNGLGGFGVPTTLFAGTDPEAIETGDFNKDGRADLIAIDPGTNSVSILPGDGTGFFFQPKSFTTGAQPSALTIGDFNGDSIPDVATANSGAKNVSLLIGVGDGSFQSPLKTDAGGNPISLRGGDFNGDGLTDLVTASNPGNNVTLFTNDYFPTSATLLVGKSGSFPFKAVGSPAPVYQVTDGNLPTGLTLDFNTGLLSGTPANSTGGNYQLKVTASNGVGSPATLAFNLVVQQTPAITSEGSAIFLVGQNGSFTFGATGFPAPTFAITSGTLPDGLTLDSTTGVLSGTPARGTSGVRKLVVTASNGVSPVATQNFTLTLQQEASITSPDNTSFNYGQKGSFKVKADGYPLPTLSIDSVPNGLSFDAGTGILSGTSTDIGTFFFNITASNGIGTDAVQSFSLTINPGNLVISLNNKSKDYGALVPQLTATFKGLANGDTPDVVSGLLIETTADQTSPVGIYPITGSGAVASNYIISYEDGALNVNPAVLTITLENKTKGYAAPLPALTSKLSGLVNGDTPDILTGLTVATTATAKSNAGDYPITGSQAKAPNYSIQYVAGTLTVTKASLTVTAENKTKVYGAILPDFTAKITGLINGDLPSVVSNLIFSSNGNAASPVGQFKISPTGATATNYSFKFVDGTLTVTKAPLSIVAEDKFKQLGEANPTLTAKFNGLTNGDTPTVITGLVIQTTATTTSPVGKYPITVSGAKADNYNLTYTNGNLSVNEVPRFTSGATTTFTYGKTGSFTIVATGQPAPTLAIGKSDLPAGLDFNPATGILSTKGTVLPGSYAFTVTASNGLPTVATQTFSLVVNKGLLTITPENKTREYGSANPVLTAGFTGLAPGDGPGVVSGLVLATTALATSSPGDYPITASGAVSTLYDISYLPGKLKVTRKSLDFNLPDLSKIYGTTINLNPLINNPANQAGSAFYSTAIDITRFSSSFTFNTLALTSTPGDGFTFIIQNAGSTALGTNAEGLGSQGIAKSVALKFDFFNNSGEGDISTGLFLNGTKPTVPATSLVGTPIDLRSDHSFTVDLNYDGSTLKAKITDMVTGLSATQNYPVDISAQVGGETAFVGFTGATGALTSRVSVQGWNWTNRAGTSLFSFKDAWDPSRIVTNGSTVLNGPVLVLTCFGMAGEVATGNGNEKLGVTLFGNGTTVLGKAGDYPLQGLLSGANAANYDLNLKSLKLTVKKAPLLIKANDAEKVYGSTPVFTGKEFSVKGDLFNGDTFTSVTLTSAATKANTGVGTLPITASDAKGSGVENYDISFGNGNYTVNKAQLTIAPEYKTKEYGAPLPVLTAAYTGLVAGDKPDAVKSLVLTTTATQNSDIGDYKITPSQATAANYKITFSDGTMTITRATLTITADNKTKTYGAALPTLTATITGLLLGDSPSSIKGLALVTNALTTSGLGTYKINPSSAIATKNYSIVYVEGTLAVTRAPLAITPDNKTKIYGEPLPSFTSTFKGLVNGDTPTSFSGLSFASNANAGSPIGDYNITASGLNAPNYDISYVPASLKVTRAPLKITPANLAKNYGQEISFNGTEFTTSGLVSGDKVDKVKITTAGSPATALVGTFPILGSQEQGTGLGNYDITYNPGTLTVNKALLTIKADDLKKTYGQTNPNFTATYTGFVNGENPSAISNLKLATVAVANSNVGTYSIIPSAATSNNYAITFGNGTLTIEKASLTITPENKNKAYGAAMPVLTATYQGLAAGDTPASITGLSLTTTGTAKSDAGQYPILASNAAATNYAITFGSGTLDVSRAKLVITADNKTKPYGAPLPSFTVSIAGLVNGDSASAITDLSLSSIATAGSGIGVYPITINRATARNYEIDSKPGSLTISAAVLTVTADSKSKVYGAGIPDLTVSYSGLTNGDTPSIVSGLQVTTTALASSKVGSYPIKVSNGVAPNYTLNFVNGNLAVTPASLTIAAENKTKIYGALLPALTVTYSGLVNGDTAAAITGLKMATTATKASKVGDYAITATGATNLNYSIQVVNGTLSVTKASLVITADNKSRKAGLDNPALTATFTGLANGDTAASISGLQLATDALKTSASGVYTITVSGANNSNYDITLNNGTLTIFDAPVFTSSSSTTLQSKTTLTYAFAVSGFPAPLFSIAKGTLPTGVTINQVTGVLNLSPATKAGVYKFTVKATNVGGSALQDFVLTLT